MAATNVIPPFTVAAGDTAFGPFVVPAGWTTLDLAVDIAALVFPLVLTLEFAPDGVTWQPLAQLDYTGPSIIRGVLNTTADLHISLPDGAPGATPQVRGTFKNTGIAWASAGGSLVVA